MLILWLDGWWESLFLGDPHWLRRWNMIDAVGFQVSGKANVTGFSGVPFGADLLVCPGQGSTGGRDEDLRI